MPTREQVAATGGPPPLVVYLDGLIEHLRGQLPGALGAFEVTAVHQSRVTTRRLGAAVSVLAPVLPGRDVKAFRKILRKLRRILGPHRDTDVLLEHLCDLGEREPAHRTAVDAMVAWMTARQERLREETREEVGLNRLTGKLAVYEDLREDLIKAVHGRHGVDQTWELIAEGVREGFDEFSTLADLLSHQLAEGDALSGLDPHELRIAGKHLRYSLELAIAHGSGLPGSVLKDFKAMQDALGAWHDEIVLAEMALVFVQEGGLMHRDAPMAGAGLRLAGQMATRAGESLKGFAAVWTERSPRLAEAIQHHLTAEADSASDGAVPVEGGGGAEVASPPLHSTGDGGAR